MLTAITPLEAPHFDLHQLINPQHQQSLMPAFSTLVKTDPLDQAKVHPDVAQRWEMSADGLSYTFELRDGVRFHDGRPLTSDDVKFSLERVAFAKPGSGIFYSDTPALRALESVQAPDRRTVIAKLKRPTSNFLPTLGLMFMAIIPKHIVDAKGDLKGDLIGSGPFKLKQRTPNVSIEFVRNEEYYDPEQPYLDGVRFVVLGDKAAQFAALQSGQAHHAGLGNGLTLDDAQVLEASGKVKVWRQRRNVPFNLFLNIKRKPYDDVRVRRAVHLAYDREEFVRVGLAKAGFVSGWVTNEEWDLPQNELMGLPGYRQPKDADRAEARKLLAEAGFAQGLKTQLVLSQRPLDLRVAQVTKDQLQHIGIEVVLDIQENVQYTKSYTERIYDALLGRSSVYDSDPSSTFYVRDYTGATFNYSEARFPELDRMIDAQHVELDAAKRKTMVRDVFNKMFELVPSVPLAADMQISTTWHAMRGYQPNPGYINFGRYESTWLEE